MKYLKLLPILLSMSCIDLITQKTVYNSLYFKGGSWMELTKLDSMRIAEDAVDFTLQFWASGGEVDTNVAPALFSIIDENDKTILALLRDSGNPNGITTIINSEVSKSEASDLDWSKPDNFHLFSFLISDTAGPVVYLDSTNIVSFDNFSPLGASKLMVGAMANESYTILENFWYGFIDEVRLWNTHLSDSTITFQSQHADKFSEHYRYTEDGSEIQTYLDSLLGLWRFNLEKPTATIEDESGFNHDGIIYTKTGFSIELSKKGAQ